MSVRLTRERFEELVVDALDELPEPFASHLDNVEIIVEDWPSPDQIDRLVPSSGEDPRTPRGGMLLGLYEGVPQTKRGPGYSWVLPDKITIFREPIMRMCRDEEEVAKQARHTVIHEIAHHFGISDDRLRELGAY